MKDALITDEVKYEIHCYDKENRCWAILDVVCDTQYDSVQEARQVLARIKEIHRTHKIKSVYRIVKLTIKKEVVK